MEEQIYKDADGELYAVKPSDVADAEAAGMVLADDAERQSFFDQDAALKAERQKTAVAAGLAPEQVDVSVPSMEDLGLVREAAKSSGANVKRMIEGPVLKQGKPSEKPQPILDPADLEEFRNRIRDNTEGLSGYAATAVENLLDGVFFDFPTWAEGALSDHLTDGDWKSFFSPQSIQMRKEQNPLTAKGFGIAGIIAPTAGTLAKALKPQLLEKAIIGPALRGAAAVDVVGKATTKAEVALLGKGVEKKAFTIVGKTEPALEAELAQARIVERMNYYGAKKGVIETLKNKAAVTGIQTVVGGAAGATKGAFEEGSRVSREATGENMGSAMMRGAIRGGIEGAAIGGAAAIAVPAGIGTVRLATNLLNGTLQKFNEKLTPILGSLITKAVTPTELQSAIAKSRDIVKNEFKNEAPDIVKALNKEFEEAAYVHEKIDLFFDTTDEVKFLQEAGIEDEVINNINAYRASIKDTEKALKEKWMTQGKDKKWVYDYDKIKKYVEKGFYDETHPVINEAGEFQFPPEIQLYRSQVDIYHKALSNIEENLYQMHNIPKDASYVNALKNAMEAEVNKITDMPTSTGIARNYSLLRPMEAELEGQLAQIEKGKVTPFTLPTALTSLFGLPTAAQAVGALGVPAAVASPFVTGIGAALLDPAAAIKTYQTIDRVAIRLDDVLSRTSNKIIFGKGGQITTQAAGKGVAELRKQYRMEEEPSYSATYENYIRETGRINEMANNIDKLSEELDRGTAGLEDYPELTEISKNSMANGIKFLQSKLPKQNGQVIQLKDWKPTKRQIDEYFRYSNYVQDPINMMIDIEEKNYIPDQALEVMRAVYPAMLKEFQVKLYQQLADAKESGTQITQQNRQMIDKVLGLSSEGLTPEQIKKNQDALNAPPTPKAGGKVGGGAQLEATPTQERELRKR